MSNVADELVKEMARVRDEVLPAYLEIGPAGMFAVTMMRLDLDAAATAMAEGDTVEMIRRLKSLQETST